MFTTPCFIRLSKPEIVDRLYRLGGRQGTHFWYSNNLTLLVAESDKYYCLDDEWGNAENLIKRGFIDCQDHEELFIALAALRNDTDKDQWFTNGNDWAIWREEGSFRGEPITGFEFHYLPSSIDYDSYHKATVEEIIEHFTMKGGAE